MRGESTDYLCCEVLEAHPDSQTRQTVVPGHISGEMEALPPRRVGIVDKGLYSSQGRGNLASVGRTCLC